MADVSWPSCTFPFFNSLDVGRNLRRLAAPTTRPADAPRASTMKTTPLGPTSSWLRMAESESSELSQHVTASRLSFHCDPGFSSGLLARGGKEESSS
eukprot:1889823-Rhodomonas_salina.1